MYIGHQAVISPAASRVIYPKRITKNQPEYLHSPARINRYFEPERAFDLVNRFLHLFHNPVAQQFIRYAGVGGFSFVVDFTCLYLLTETIGWHYLASATLAFCAGLITNYLLCLLWVFDFRRMQNRLHEFTVFGLIGLGGLLLNNLLLYSLTDLIGLYYLLSKVLAAAFILLFNFGLRRWMLFSPPRAATLKTTP